MIVIPHNVEPCEQYFLQECSANEMFFFIAEFERAAKIRKNAVYRFLISLLVPELFPPFFLLSVYKTQYLITI